MKYFVFLFSFFVFVSFTSKAQKTTKEIFTKNNIKLNLFGLALRNFSLQYERGLNPKISASLGVRFMPKGSVPFQGSLRNSVKNDPADSNNAGLDFVNNAQISSWAITPEFRYYFGKQPLNGFYVAPFLRIGGYGIDWDYKFERNNGTVKPVHLMGRSTAFSGGILLGAQWHIGKHVLLDWWILGPQYGSYNVKLDASGDFSDLSQQDQAELKKTIESIGFNGNKTDASVTNTSVTANSKISLPGLRTGFCVGYTF
ncbi:MAG: DUF3575 domain-containing protein [Bacteroidetes bacterium]|nr:DUF3575 domain-containing protein [Bacteroidota bacterium]